MTKTLDLKGRDFLTLADYTQEELLYLLDRAEALKQTPLLTRPLVGKNLALIFEKPSTRTRVSFEVGMNQLGGDSVVLSSDQMQLGRGETIADTAKVLSRYVQGIMIRTFAQDTVIELAKYADIPVINGLTDMYHPCQVLADLLTIREKKGQLGGLKLAYFGDGNNMAHSLMIGGALMGMQVAIAAPAGYQPAPEVTDKAQKIAVQSGGQVLVTADPQEAAKGADVLYTDVWVSMGQEDGGRKNLLAPFQVNTDLLKLADPSCLVMHCLPAHYGEEITSEVAESANSVIFDQAENRLHAQKAILAELLG